DQVAVFQGGPGNLLYVMTASREAEQTGILIGDPHVLVAVFDDGAGRSARNRADGDEPVVLQVANAARCRKPVTPLTILKDGQARPTRHANPIDLAPMPVNEPAGRSRCATLAVNGHVASCPSVQSVVRAQPHASVVGGDDRRDVVV